MPGKLQLAAAARQVDRSIPRIGGTGKSSSRTGAYLLVDQAVWRDELDPASVLRVFGQAATSNAATSPMRRWYSLGLIKQKPFASRPHDTISFGYGRAVINQRTRDVQEAAATSVEQSALIIWEGHKAGRNIGYGQIESRHTWSHCLIKGLGSDASG